MYTSHIVEVQYHIQHERENILFKKKQRKQAILSDEERGEGSLEFHIRIIFMIQVEVSIILVGYSDEYLKQTFGILN